MLRHLLLLTAGLFAIVALAVAIDQPGAWPMLLGAVVLLVAILFERTGYRGGRRGQGGTWQATPERFLDEKTGLPVTVWFNAVTGERRYVEHGEAPPR